MSAIFGIISKTGNNVEKAFSEMEKSISIFPFDKINRLEHDGSFFGAGLQYITHESIWDSFPMYDEDAKIVFCSNCFLYNRDSLISEIAIVSEKLSDSEIAFYSYKKWGVHFVEHLRGNFCFVVFEKEKGLVHLFSDHFSSQYLVYHDEKSFFTFSSTFKPVLAALSGSVKLNKEFIVNAYRDTSPATFFKERITPYETVYQVDYATHVTINLTNGAETRERYWNPTKTVRPLKLKNHDEYKQAFISLYESLVSAFLRGSRETGIMLSGGLDSSSVLAFAAPILKSKGKKIYSYTSVPCDDYDCKDLPPYIMANESPLIMDQKKKHDNLEPHFINCDNKCSLFGIDYYQKLYDLPVKTAANNLNISYMLDAAEKDNCSIILSGSNGNASISYGYLSQYLSLSLTKLHFIKAYKTIAEYCKINRLSRKKVTLEWVKDAYNALLKPPKDEHLLLNLNDEKEFHLMHPAKEHRKRNGSSAFVTFKQRVNFILLPAQFIQKGFFYTNQCLMHKMILLDPTATVEMVEFCLSLPMECYVHGGTERSLIRDYLKELLPKSITDMYKPFGRQCSDFEYRINRDWNIYKKEILEYLHEPLLSDYLDESKISSIVSAIEKDGENHNLSHRQAVLVVLLSSLACFLREHSK